MRNGANWANDLKQYVEDGLGLNKGLIEVKRHTYIYSQPGAGKTYTVIQTAAAHKLDLIAIRGVNSMPNFVRRLAAELYYKTTPEIVVWVDDCDLFSTKDSLNIMKGALDKETNLFVYGKTLSGEIARGLASTDQKIIDAAIAIAFLSTTAWYRC